MDKARYWSTKLFQATGQCLAWGNIEASTHEKAIEDDTYTYRDAATSLRKHLDVNGLSKATKPTIKRGAFPSYHGNDEEQPSEDKDKDNSKKPNKRKRAHTQTTKPCLVCGTRYHQLKNCWYAFPEKSPEDWTGSENVHKIAEDNMQKEEVKKAMAAIQGKRRKASDETNQQ
jgi:hypothetical protein